jgi:hypothetical protein
MSEAINLFYEEPDPDRLIAFDRYPRRWIRRLIRGPHRPRGQMRVFLNLCRGLDKLGVSYRVNDYRHAMRNPEEVVGIIGKPFVLDKVKWKNPIVFGASIFSHPLSDPHLLERLPVKKVLVPGEWMRQMCEPYYGEKVKSWPVGIDTQYWAPDPVTPKIHDFLIYDKVLWEHDRYEKELIEPIRSALTARNLSFSEIRYGSYQEKDFHQLLKRSKAMIFLCEHETQGIAYQQALAMGVPILAWDCGGYWKDPEFYPEKVKYRPVSSVPYWDERCGVKFTRLEEFGERLDQFTAQLTQQAFSPRIYIRENLTLEKCAKVYLEELNSVLP